MKKKLDAEVFSFGHPILRLSLHYRVKCRSRCLAIDSNEFLLGSICVGSEIINWIATNAIIITQIKMARFYGPRCRG